MTYRCPGRKNIEEVITLRNSEGYVKTREQLEKMLITYDCTSNHEDLAIGVNAAGVVKFRPRVTRDFQCGCECHKVDLRNDPMLGH